MVVYLLRQRKRRKMKEGFRCKHIIRQMNHFLHSGSNVSILKSIIIICCLDIMPNDRQHSHYVSQLRMHGVYNNYYIIHAGLSSRSTARPTVANPIYETGEDVYEEIPDREGNKLTSDQLYSDVAPALPPARYDFLPNTVNLSPGKEGTSASATPLTQTPKQDRKLATLDIPKCESAGALSTGSGEECYIAMNRAGAVTMMPRNQHSDSRSMSSGEATGSVDGRYTLSSV